MSVVRGMEQLAYNTSGSLSTRPVQQQGNDGNLLYRELAAANLPRLPKARRANRPAPRKTKKEWEEIRLPFKLLYVEEDLCLTDVMKRLESDHGFTATQNQLKLKIQQWKFDKKVKGSEMKHILKIQRRRRRQNPAKETKFSIRNKPVDETKIERYKQEHRTASTPSSCTPTSVTYRSPSYEESSQPAAQDDAWKSFVRWSETLSPSAIAGAGDSPDHASVFPEPGRRFEGAVANEAASTDLFLFKRLNRPSSPAQHTSEECSHRLNQPKSLHSNRNVMYPALEAFRWWSDYSAYHTRQNSPIPNQSPLFETLRTLVVAGDNYEDEMFNRVKFQEFEILKAEGLDQGSLHANQDPCWHLQCPVDCDMRVGGFLYTSQKVCPQQALTGLLRFYRLCTTAYSSGSITLSYKPDRRWCLSEASKLAFQYSKGHPNLIAILATALGNSFLRLEVHSFCRAVFAHFQAGTDNSSPFFNSMATIIPYIYASGNLPNPNQLLNIVRENCVELSYLPEIGNGDRFLEMPTNAPNPRLVLEYRYAISVANTIKWFSLHPLIANRVFSTGTRFACVTACYGIRICDYHFCFSGSCSSGSSNNMWPKCISSDEDLNLYELEYVDEGFSMERDFFKIALQGLWLFIQKSGHLLESAELEHHSTVLEVPSETPKKT